jgi:sorbitol-specific phosphotransferase system component IIBC
VGGFVRDKAVPGRVAEIPAVFGVLAMVSPEGDTVPDLGGFPGDAPVVGPGAAVAQLLGDLFSADGWAPFAVV